MSKREYDYRLEKSPAWKGGRTKTRGYVHVKSPGHPRANCRNYALEHVLVAEKALGKPLPLKAEVHHVDMNRGNNRNDNLVICPNHAYHQLLHTRTRALKACGHASWRRCKFCKQWDDPKNLRIYSNQNVQHKTCQQDYDRKRYQIRKSRALAQPKAA